MRKEEEKKKKLLATEAECLDMQSLVCVTVEYEQHCVTGIINSLQQPVFTVLLQSIDNPLGHLAYFHNFYG